MDFLDSLFLILVVLAACCGAFAVGGFIADELLPRGFKKLDQWRKDHDY